jgi:hypothetical protein
MSAEVCSRLFVRYSVLRDCRIRKLIRNEHVWQVAEVLGARSKVTIHVPLDAVSLA